MSSLRTRAALVAAVGAFVVVCALIAALCTGVTVAPWRRVLCAGAGAVLAAAALGWILGGRIARPFVELTRQITQGTPMPVRATARFSVREARQLSVAVTDLVDEVTRAQDRTQAALEAARIFAASAAHELRTPLTAMRTDLEVVRGLDLSHSQYVAILDDVLRIQAGIESTLTALEQLASGELARDNLQRVGIDVAELAEDAATDARRRNPDVAIEVRSAGPVLFDCLPSGIRLTIDNAVANAIKHGQATTILIGVERTRGRLAVTVDDNGTGIPGNERDAVFGRFYRGTNAAGDGSGLGLALVAQQAEIHNGRAYFTDSHLGGIRLFFDIPSGGRESGSH
ncbi:HAMP domain-containing sensor histidine kinase [Nocardia sp. NPDC049190]|uniref:sensor histidine kinase n=1 Tax=Nocardia sp. NPDC049190 TaxID=3155650 RepID=UPI00340DA3DC